VDDNVPIIPPCVIYTLCLLTPGPLSGPGGENIYDDDVVPRGSAGAECVDAALRWCLDVRRRKDRDDA